MMRLALGAKWGAPRMPVSAEAVAGFIKSARAIPPRPMPNLLRNCLRENALAGSCPVQRGVFIGESVLLAFGYAFVVAH